LLLGSRIGQAASNGGPHTKARMAQREILFNAFSMNCVGHINHGL
jgi:hypothetical protein